MLKSDLSDIKRITVEQKRIKTESFTLSHQSLQRKRGKPHKSMFNN